MAARKGVVQVEATIGSINSSEGSGKVYIFHSPHNGGARSGAKETHMSEAIKGFPEVGRFTGASSGSRYNSIPSRSNILKEVGGRTSSVTFELKEGEIIKVFTQGKARGWNAPMHTGAMYLQARPTAAFVNVVAKANETVSDRTAVWQVRGRFDILTLDLVKALGCKVLKSCEGQSTPLSCSAVFRVESLEPEVSAVAERKVKVIGDKAIVVSRRRRALSV